MSNLNFNIKHLDNVQFSYDELVDYYETVKSQYDHLRWVPDGYDQKDHAVNNIYGWAIQSNYTDPEIPCPPYHFDHECVVKDPNESFSIPTKLIFGFAKKIIDTFPEVRQTVLSAHPPGTVINQHIDNTEYFKIHIPIYTNNKSYFVFGDEKYVLEQGKAYFINTKYMHGTENAGDTERVHLIFKIPYSRELDVLKDITI